MKFDLEGKVALVTGGGAGIGRASCQILAEAGCKVVATDINQTAAQETAEAIGPNAIALYHDVSKEPDWEQVMEQTLARFGRLDILVNNAGIGGAGDLENVTLDFWNQSLAVNLTGTFLGCKHGVGAIKQSEGQGSIINMSSITGFVGVSDVVPYCAAKGGVRLLTKAVALNCCAKKYNIRCNSIHPTVVDTDMLMKPMIEMVGDRETAEKALNPLVPMGRIAKPLDIAQAVLFLASEYSSLITGTELVVDGGTIAGIMTGLTENER